MTLSLPLPMQTVVHRENPYNFLPDMGRQGGKNQIPGKEIMTSPSK